MPMLVWIAIFTFAGYVMHSVGGGWLVYLIVICLVLACIWLLREKCKSCGSRLGFKWRYARVDGGPDRRYGNNSMHCISCGAEKK